MIEIGRIQQYTKSGNLIIQTKHKIIPDTKLLDAKGKKVAVSIDLIGPINSPYIIAKPLIENPYKIVNLMLYVTKEKRRKHIANTK